LSGRTGNQDLGTTHLPIVCPASHGVGVYLGKNLG
jgi:hypothetical protein